MQRTAALDLRHSWHSPRRGRTPNPFKAVTSLILLGVTCVAIATILVVRISPNRESTRSVESDPEPSATVAVVERIERPVDAADAGEDLATDVRRALLNAVAIARAQPDPTQETPEEVDASSLPHVEMTWEQYRGWTKFAAALAKRDYQNVETMLPEMQRLFGASFADALVDTYVADYAALLDDIIAARCDGYDRQSVWRKTMFMTFALARLDRSSAALDRQANLARAMCGYAS